MESPLGGRMHFWPARTYDGAYALPFIRRTEGGGAGGVSGSERFGTSSLTGGPVREENAKENQHLGTQASVWTHSGRLHNLLDNENSEGKRISEHG